VLSLVVSRAHARIPSAFVIVSIVSCVSAGRGAGLALSHAEPGGRAHTGGMVQFDQFILALVACAAVGRLICAG
jgi:hypothetical protein